MTALESRLLGFDIRRPAKDYVSTLWSQGRRERYLLEPGIEWPLSVDNLAWPSLFKYSEPVPPVAVLQQLATISSEPESTENGLWLDLSRMREFYNRAGGAHRGIEIGIELVASSGLRSDQFGSPLLDRNPVPSKLPERAVPLGFDVADAALVSALSNCSYKPEEKDQLHVHWSKKLNEHGLFQSLNDAIEFRSISETRVPQHAPFWVYRLYRLN